MPTPEPVSAHALLVEQHAFLRRLARSLVADPERADDLAQDVALLALRRPPRAGGSARAWLARVLRNRAVSVARGDSRRRDREAALPERAPPPTPPELEERYRVQRAVVEAVGHLDEPYRQVVLLRYDRELSPTAIAEHLGLPVATVKTRLARALARLRRDLDEHEGPGTPSWSVVLLAGLDDLRPSAATTAAAAGGAIVGAKLVGVVAAVVAVSLSALWWTQQRPAARAPHDPTAKLDLAAGAQLDLPGSAELQAEERFDERLEVVIAPRVAPGAELDPSFSLELHVLGLDADVTAPARIELRSQTAQEALVREIDLAATCRVDLDSLFLGVDPRPRRLSVLVDHPARMPARFDLRVPGEWTEATFPGGVLFGEVALVAPKAIVTGEVRFPDGPPSHPVRVDAYVWSGDEPGLIAIDTTATDAAHRFRLRLDDHERHVLVAYEDLGHDALSRLRAGDRPLRPASTEVELTRGEQRDLSPLEMERGRIIRGTVSGSPIWETAVSCFPRTPTRSREQLITGGPNRPVAWIDGHFENHALLLPTEDGAFELSGLGPLEYDLRAQIWTPPEHEDTWSWSRELEPMVRVQAPAEGVVLVLNQVRTTIEVLWNGQPVSRANVEYSLIEAADLDEQTRASRFPISRIQTDELGRFSLRHSRGLGLHVRAYDARFGATEVDFVPEELVDGAILRVALEGTPQEPATLVVHFDGDSTALGSFHPMSLRAYDLSNWSHSELERVLSSRLPWSQNSLPGAPTDYHAPSRERADMAWNRWTFHLRPGRYLVCAGRTAVSADPMGLALGTSFVVDLPEGATVHETWHSQLGGLVRVRISSSSSGAPRLVSGDLCTEDGEELHVAYTNSGGSHWGNFASMSSFEVVPALPEGDYQLVLRLAGAGTRTVDVHVDAGRTTEVEIDLSRL